MVVGFVRNRWEVLRRNSEAALKRSVHSIQRLSGYLDNSFYILLAVEGHKVHRQLFESVGDLVELIQVLG